MHELSIAISIVEIAAEQLDRHGGGRVQTVHLRLGPLSGVVKEALVAAFPLACDQTPLQGATLDIEDVPLEIYCQRCGQNRPAQSPQMMLCNVCGTPSARVVRGRELDLISLEICDDEVCNDQTPAAG